MLVLSRKFSSSRFVRLNPLVLNIAITGNYTSAIQMGWVEPLSQREMKAIRDNK